MIRYAGLKEQLAAGVTRRTPDGMTPAEQVRAIAERLHGLVERHRRTLRDSVLPALAERGVRIRSVAELDDAERDAVHAFFDEELYPVLTPLAVDSSHPFPRLPNLSFSLLLDVADEVTGAVRGAVVQVPSVLPRFLRLPGAGHDFVMLEDIILARIGELFPGHVVRRAHGFRITRNADIEIAEDEADDLLHAIEDEVRRRRWGDAARLEVDGTMPAAWRERLRRTLELEPEDVYTIPNHLNASDFLELTRLDLPDLRDPPFAARLPTEYRDHAGALATVAAGDVLVHHPFHAFDAVQMLVDEAADDPRVLAIKMTLYRVGLASPVVAALARAAGNGKLVTALVELKARFDEENNIVWARELERAGVHVVYGFVGLKTHCKALLVVRREQGEGGRELTRRYVHLGTGNYNPSTADVYTDLALMTPRRGARSRRQRPVQLPHRLQQAAHLEEAVGGSRGAARAGPGGHRTRACAGGAGREGPHHRQDERAGGPRRDPGAVPRLAGRRGDRPDRAGDLLPAARRAGRQREHPRAQRGRALPGALAHLLLPSRRRRRPLPGQRRLDAAQPRSPHRDGLPGGGRAPPAQGPPGARRCCCATTSRRASSVPTGSTGRCGARRASTGWTPSSGCWSCPNARAWRS